MSTVFLISAIAGLLLAMNGYRALRFPLLVVPAFFAAWLTIELAPHLLVTHIVAVALFVIGGALAEWHGWVALAISTLTAALLLRFVRESYRVHEVLDVALSDAIGPAAAHTPVAWKEFAFPFKLWTRNVKRKRNVPYVPGGGRRYRLDVWHDADASGADRPCLLYVPGGAWTVGISNKDQQGKPLLIEMASRGWVCFAMNYPVSPRARFPAHVIAVKRAIAWIREHAHEYGGDARFLMLSGNSAGGHLSSLAALSPDDSSFQPGFEDADTTVQAAAPLYGVYDLTGAQLEELPRWQRRHKKGALRFFELTVMQRRLAKDREIFEKGSPWHRIGPHAPPFLIIHGAMDTLALAAEARAFAQLLRDASNEPVIYAELPGAQHAFDQFLSVRTLYVVRAVARFGDWAHERWRANAGVRSDLPQDQAARNPTSTP